MSNPSRQHSKALYRWGFRRRGKTGKHRKVGGKRKWRVLAQPPYSPQGKGRQGPRVEPYNQGEIGGGEPREPVSAKTGKTSETAGAYIHVKQE